jgi:hypothetical protein
VGKSNLYTPQYRYNIDTKSILLSAMKETETNTSTVSASAQDRGEWSTPRSGRFYCRDRTPVIPGWAPIAGRPVLLLLVLQSFDLELLQAIVSIAELTVSSCTSGALLYVL